MDVEPPTGDDLNRMLVSMKQDVLRRAAAEPPARRRPWARRHLGLTLGLVALLGVGGAGGALALVLPSPFQASPAATPTSTPSATPTPRPTPSAAPSPSAPPPQTVPAPATGIDCATLGDRARVTSLVPAAQLVTVPLGLWGSGDAAYRQAGVLDCRWTAGGAELSEDVVEIRISPAADRGREWISGLTQSGLPGLQVGDVSAARCEDDYGTRCNASLVSGPWWIELSLGATVTSAPVTTETTRTAAASVVTVTDALTPGAPWAGQESSWAGTSCAALPSGRTVGELAGSPDMGDVVEQGWTPATGIRQTQAWSTRCSWTIASADDTQPDGYVSGVTVEFVSGSAWAYGRETVPGTPVEVAGADSATLVCYSHEGASCWVDLVSDGTWVQVLAYVDPEDSGLLIPLSEAVLAAQAAASGRG